MSGKGDPGLSALGVGALRPTGKDTTNGAPCLGIAVALGGGFWLGVSALLALAA
jgi:hypothetical protein